MDARVIVVACVLFDALDAVLALAFGTSLLGAMRTLGGTVLAAVVVDILGLLYAWEFAAVLAGYPAVTAVPTLTLLVVLRALR